MNLTEVSARQPAVGALHLLTVIVPQRHRKPVGMRGKHLMRDSRVRIEEEQSIAAGGDAPDGRRVDGGRVGIEGDWRVQLQLAAVGRRPSRV